MRTNRRTMTMVALAFLLAAAVRCAGVEPVPPKILLSNDDGIEAPGLATLFDALQKVGTVTVAAPVREQSGISHGMTTRKLIPVRKSERKGATWFAIDATPASCVRLALESLLPEKPDIVIAGTNRGENVGLVTFYSATVAAAREAAFLRIPAISVNLQSGPDMDYKAAADFTSALVRELARKGFEKGMLLNINIPALPKDRIKGIMITRQDVRPTMEFFEKRETGDGQDSYWPSYKTLDAGPENTDTWAVRNGYIAVTPLTLDQTDAAALKRLKGLEKLVWK
ncbi:MAG: 5'/3'-nucleotidase SurE [Candidatus Aminicenantales bacterium]